MTEKPSEEYVDLDQPPTETGAQDKPLRTMRVDTKQNKITIDLTIEDLDMIVGTFNRCEDLAASIGERSSLDQGQFFRTKDLLETAKALVSKNRMVGAIRGLERL